MRVAVIGGGAVGLSVAWHLVERGITDVVVLEAGESVAAGSSSRSAGFIESQYIDPYDIELRARSMHTFRRLQRDHGLEVKEIGYLRLAPDDATLETFETSVGVQREFGIDDAEVLDAERVGQLVPCLRTEGIAGGLWGPRDGRIDGPAYCRLLVGLTEAGGATVRTNARVVGASKATDGWRIELADTDVIDADIVVNAAGPWAARVGRLLGVDVPVVPLRNQIGIWRLKRPLDRVMPMVMDYIPHSGARGLYVATYDDADHVLARPAQRGGRQRGRGPRCVRPASRHRLPGRHPSRPGAPHARATDGRGRAGLGGPLSREPGRPPHRGAGSR